MYTKIWVDDKFEETPAADQSEVASNDARMTRLEALLKARWGTRISMMMCFEKDDEEAEDVERQLYHLHLACKGNFSADLVTEWTAWWKAHSWCCETHQIVDAPDTQYVHVQSHRTAKYCGKGPERREDPNHWLHTIGYVCKEYDQPAPRTGHEDVIRACLRWGCFAQRPIETNPENPLHTGWLTAYQSAKAVKSLQLKRKRDDESAHMAVGLNVGDNEQGKHHVVIAALKELSTAGRLTNTKKGFVQGIYEIHRRFLPIEMGAAALAWLRLTEAERKQCLFIASSTSPLHDDRKHLTSACQCTNSEHPSGCTCEMFPWMLTALEKLEAQDDRQVLWVVDNKGSTGKTQFQKWLQRHRNAFARPGGTLKDFMNSMDAHDQSHGKADLVCINLVRCTKSEYWPYTTIENLKDGVVVSDKYHSTVASNNGRKVAVFSNEHPDLSALTDNRWDVMLLEGTTAPGAAGSMVGFGGFSSA